MGFELFILSLKGKKNIFASAVEHHEREENWANIKSHMNKIVRKRRMGKWESDQREAMWREIRMEKKKMKQHEVALV